MKFLFILISIGKSKLKNRYLLFSLLLILAVRPVSGQEFQQLMGDYPFATTLEFESFHSGKIKETKFSFSQNVMTTKKSRFALSGRYFELTNSLRGIPNFTNSQFGVSYRRNLEDKKSIGVSASFGSSSDKPFEDGRDGVIQVNGTYQLNENWIILGNYSNNRPFLNNIPLPGFLYTEKHSREESVMLGFPFIYILKPFSDEIFSFKYVAILPYNHKIRVLFNKVEWVKPYVGLEQQIAVFFDSERFSDRVRTFWKERKAVVGLEKSFGPFLKIDFQTGNSFDREYFNALSYARKHSDVRRIHDGAFVCLSLKSSF